MKIDIKCGTPGVYLLKCKENGKRYIGASVDAGARIRQHFSNKLYKKYPHSEMYQDIHLYGVEGFEITLLEHCTKEDKLEKEQKWYDEIKPEYNLVRPCAVREMFKQPEIRERALKKCKSEEFRKAKSEQYKQDKYVKMFRETAPWKARPVVMLSLDDVEIRRFPSIREAAKYIQKSTEFKGKSIPSHIKEVCDGKRPSAYKHHFKYLEV